MNCITIILVPIPHAKFPCLRRTTVMSKRMQTLWNSDKTKIELFGKINLLYRNRKVACVYNSKNTQKPLCYIYSPLANLLPVLLSSPTADDNVSFFDDKIENNFHTFTPSPIPTQYVQDSPFLSLTHFAKKEKVASDFVCQSNLKIKLSFQKN